MLTTASNGQGRICKIVPTKTRMVQLLGSDYRRGKPPYRIATVIQKSHPHAQVPLPPTRKAGFQERFMLSPPIASLQEGAVLPWLGVNLIIGSTEVWDIGRADVALGFNAPN